MGRSDPVVLAVSFYITLPPTLPPSLPPFLSPSLFSYPQRGVEDPRALGYVGDGETLLEDTPAWRVGGREGGREEGGGVWSSM